MTARAVARYNLLKTSLDENEAFFGTEEELPLEEIEIRQELLKTFLSDLSDAFVESDGQVTMDHHQTVSTRLIRLQAKIRKLVREKMPPTLNETVFHSQPDVRYDSNARLNTEAYGPEAQARNLTVYGQLMRQFENHENYFRDAVVEDLPLPMLETRLDRIQPLMMDMNHAISGCAAGALNFDEHLALENRYYDLVSKIQCLIEAKIPVTRREPVNYQRETSDVLRTPKMDLPKFDGSIEKWPHYRDLFTALVHDNPKLSDIVKYSYLDSTFIIAPGQPNILKDYSMTAECYQTVWKAVCDRYNDKRRIIAHHMNAILSTKKMTSYTAVELLRVLSGFTSNLSALADQGFAVDETQTVADMVFVHLLTARLDDEVIREWRKHCNADVPTWKELSEYLTVLWRSCQDLESKRPMTSKPAETKPGKPSKTFASTSGDDSKTSGRCQLCNQTHGLWICPKFKAMNNNDRWNVVRRNRLCFICLRTGHGTVSCPNLNMRCKKCEKPHGNLLHYESPSDDSQGSYEAPPALQQSGNLNSQANTFKPFEMNKKQTSTFAALTSRRRQAKKGQGLLSTAIVLIEDGDGILQPVRALLDSGGEDSSISEEMAKKLGLRTKSQFRPVEGIGANAVVSKKKAFAQMESRYGKYVRNLELDVLPRISGDYPTISMDAESFDIPDDIFLADPTFCEASDIDMILSNEIYLETELPNKMKLKSGPYLKETMFGWTVGGRIDAQPSSSKLLCSFSRSYKSHSAEVDQSLEKFLSADEFEYASPTLTAEEKFCEKLFAETTKISKDDGKLIVQMPFKSNFEQLGNNLANAKRTLAWQEGLRKKDETYDRLYCEYMEDYLKSGFMTEVTPIEGEVAHYLPHHGVLKMTSTSTKLRPVFNAASKSETGLSLNDVLCVGPTVQSESFDLMLRFREKKFVLTADIKKMFLQVWVAPEQRKYLRILWRPNMDTPVKHYELKTVTFGTACAPFLAQRSLMYIAANYEDIYPDAAKIVKESFYMDDLVHSTESIEKGLRDRDHVRYMLEKSGMPLCKFSSNSRELIDDLPPHLVEQPEEDEITATKTLGIVYRANQDQFSYDLKPMDKKEKMKRVEAMSQVASVYDPIGWIGPVLMKAKLFLKELCMLKLDWNDEIPIELQETWEAFREKFKILNSIRLDRRCYIDNHVTVELHGFSDASIVGYGAVIYALSKDEFGNSQVSLICAKSRVAPKSQKTLARLELCSATLLATLIDRIIKTFTVDFRKITLWSDSTITLSWIAITPTSRLQTFVGNRVAVIQELTHKYVWKHIRGTENPADVLSRGLAPDELLNCELWWSGPKFLRLPETEWPNSIITINEDDPEVKQELKKTFTIRPGNDMLEYIETRWSRPRVLINCVAWMLRFGAKEKLHPPENKKFLTIDETDRAELAIIRILQMNYLAEEYRLLMRSGIGEMTTEMPKNSLVRALAPFLDGNNVMRVGGRLERSSELNYDQKHQLVLPESNFAYILIKDLHERNLHPGPLQMESILKQKYWPLKTKKMIQRVTRNCLVCFKAKPKIPRQFMSDLPEARVTMNPPFTETAIDYAGFYYIRFSHARKSSTTKAYVALFKCMSTLAIHLELVSDLTSAAFIAALDRFTSRRGLSRKIYCDNGTCFVGADSELKKIVSENQKDVDQHCRDVGVEFMFTTPRAPHAGGIYEAGIKNMKKHLRIALGTSVFTFEHFTTILCKIEAILNSRPLTPMSEDPNDLHVLTPGHFLIGRPLIALPQRHQNLLPAYRLNRWDEIQKIQQLVWRDWHRDYLHHLQSRPVDFRTKFEVNVGDMVLVHESNLPPQRWMLGRIVKLMPDRKTNVVRNVIVKTVNGEKARHVKYLSFLPFEKDLPLERPEGVCAKINGNLN